MATRDTSFEVNYASRGDTTATLTRNDTWKAQYFKQESSSKPDPPSVLNVFLAMLSCVFCPLLGFLALLYAIEAKVAYNHGKYSESDALCSRAKGTSYYGIAIGIGLAVGLGVLLGLGSRFGWY